MKVGDTFYARKEEGKPSKCHIIAIVEEEMIVYKWYSRRHQWWHYEIAHYLVITYLAEKAQELQELVDKYIQSKEE